LACGLLVRTNSVLRRRIRHTTSSDVLPVRAGASPESTTCADNIAAENSLRILRRLGEVDHLYCRGDPPNRGVGSVAVGAGRNVVANMDSDFWFSHRLRPAGERDACSGLDECISRQQSYQRSTDIEALEHLRRSEPDLPP